MDFVTVADDAGKVAEAAYLAMPPFNLHIDTH